MLVLLELGRAVVVGRSDVEGRTVVVVGRVVVVVGRVVVVVGRVVAVVGRVVVVVGRAVVPFEAVLLVPLLPLPLPVLAVTPDLLPLGFWFWGVR